MTDEKTGLEPIKRPVGRPRREVSELPELWYEEVLELYAEGASDVEIKVILNVSNDIWARWMKEEPEFQETIKIGKELSRAWWETVGRRNLANGKFNSTLWYMNMKNRFGWADRSETKVDVSDKMQKIIEKGIEIANKYGGIDNGEE